MRPNTLRINPKSIKVGVRVNLGEDPNGLYYEVNGVQLYYFYGDSAPILAWITFEDTQNIARRFKLSQN